MNDYSNDQEGTKETRLTVGQVAQLVAFCLVGSFFIFMSGFYLGKWRGTEPFMEQIAADSFADKVSNAFSTLYDASDEEEGEAADNTNEPVVTAPEKPSERKAPALYIAQIAGFGTQKAATQCLENLKNHGFAVTLRTRKSLTAKGKEIIWYQVITQPVEDKEQLGKLVEQIKKIAKVKDVPIIKVEHQ